MDYKPGYTENGYSFAGGDPSDQANWKQVGSIEDGYKFKGGDPANKDSWEEVKEPDMSAVKNTIEQNVAVYKTVANKKGAEKPDQVNGFWDALEYGYQMSTIGLASRGKMPDRLMPEDAESAARIASQVGQLAGDVPAMIAGAFGGGVAASPTVVGAPIGAAAGAFALPAALRTAMVDAYQKGDIQDSKDFMERTSAIFLSAINEGSVGAASSMVGGKVGTELMKTAAPAVVKSLAPAMAEVATMTTISKAAEGHLPNAVDFAEGAVMVAGMHGATHVGGKLMDVYAKTGLKPAEVAEKMAEHPTVMQDLLSDNKPFPEALENYVERPAPPKGIDHLPAYDPKATVDSVMKDMIGELKKSERSQSLSRNEQGEVTNRVDENTYPEWYAKVKSGNLEKTIEALNNPNSAASKRLRSEAEARLTEGYKLDRKNGGYELPDAQYRASMGMDPHEASNTKAGEVIHFDGNDGVIKTPEGETVHFDASSVKENFKVGDTVHFTKDPNITDFTSAEAVFGTKTKEQIEAAKAPKEDVIHTSEDGEVTVQTADGGTRPPTAQEKILGQIGEKGKKDPKKFSYDNLYTNLVDKFNPIDLAVKDLSGGEKISTSVNPYDLARMANDYKAKVKHVFERGMIDFKTLAVTGKGFKEIIAPFASNPKKIDGLKAYMIAERALEIEGRGITSGFDLDAARQVVADGKYEYAKTAKELVDFQNGALKYAKDAGLISDKSYDAMLEAGKSYVSFSRVIEPEDIGGRNPGKAKPLKNLKGSERMIQDPFKSMMENTEALFKASEANRSTNAMIDLVESVKDQTVIEKVKKPMRPIEISDAEVSKFFKDNGIDADAEAFNIFRPQEHKGLAPDEFEVMRNGKREVYKTIPELADAFNRLKGDAGSTNMAFKIANSLTAIKKLGITFTPDFQFKNVFRDQFTSGVFSEGGSIPFKDIFGAMGDIISKNDTYYNWLKSGGAGGAFLELDSAYLTHDLLKLSGESGMADKVFNLVKKPAEYLTLMGTIMEEGTRLAEFKRVTKGATEGDILFKGGMASREVTVDFQRVGAKTSALNAITAFQNVAIQGLDRTVRAAKADPMGVTTKGLMYLTAPSILLWWANHDDERYKEIPRWQKDLFWIIPTNDWQPAKDAGEIQGMPKHLIRQKDDGSYEINKGHIYRLPKPQELGLIFGTIPERMMEKFFTDNPRALTDLGETIQGLVSPNLIPDAALPLIEQGVNKNLFTSAPLVSPQMEARLPELQYTEYTSQTAKVLGKLIGQIPLARDIGPNSTKTNSPAVIDNYIKSWTGALGSYVVEVADKALEKSGVVPEIAKPTSTLSDIPFIKAFTIRHPTASTQSITDFYSRSAEAEKVFKSIEFLVKSGDMEGVKKITDNPDYQEVMVKTGDTKQALGQMSNAVKAIYANKEMSRDEKRQQIDTIYYMMTETAKMGNQMMDEWAKGVKKKNEK